MFIDLIRIRRSVRKFRDRDVEPEKIDLLIEAALRSPSSRGFNPWEFVVVTEPELLGRLSAAKPHGALFLKRAPLAVVVCADPRKSDVWVEDASIAAIFLHLAAASLDLGSCWIQIRKRDHDPGRTAGDFVRDLLRIPEGLEVESIVAIGYPAEEKTPHPASSLMVEKVSYNRYGQKS